MKGLLLADDGDAAQIQVEVWCYFHLITNLFLFFFLLSTHTKNLQDVAAYIKKEFDKKHNPTW